jgi:hypothetical protein
MIQFCSAVSLIPAAEVAAIHYFPQNRSARRFIQPTFPVGVGKRCRQMRSDFLLLTIVESNIKLTEADIAPKHLNRTLTHF